MEQNTIFSVVIPVCNAAEYLQDTLGKLPIGCNFRFVFVDDGSTDNSAEILQNYCKNDGRALLLRQPHSGVSAARNRGISAAEGDYIMFLDCDDYIFPNAYNTLASLAEGMPDIIVFGARVVNYDSSCTIGDIEPRNVVYKPFNPDVLFKEAGSKPYVWNCAYRRDFLTTNSLKFSSKLEVGEDMLFQFCAMPKAGTIRFSSDKLYCYNYLKYGSVMSRYDKSAAMRAESSIKLIGFIIEEWKADGCYSKYGSAFISWIYEFLHGDFRLLNAKEYKQYSAQLRQTLKKYGVALQKLKLPLKRKLRLYGLLHRSCRVLINVS